MYSTVNEIMLKHSKTFRVLVSLRVSPQIISIAPGLNQVKAIMEVMNLFRWFPQGFIARCPDNDHHGRIQAARINSHSSGQCRMPHVANG